MNFDKMENVGNFNILQFPRAEFYKTNIKLRVAAGPVRIQGFHPRRCAALLYQQHSVRVVVMVVLKD